MNNGVDVDTDTLMPGDNGWPEYRLAILQRLEKIDADLHDARAEIYELKTALIALQVKAATWGAIAGVTPSLIAAAVVWFTRHT